MLVICITFDYELFFGKTEYSVEDVLIKPTNQIMDILDEKNVKATFFADIPMCIRFRELEYDSLADDIDRQMIEMLSRGNDVQLHVHPAWYKAKKIGTNWQFDDEHYGLHSFQNERHGINEIIHETSEYLSELLKPVSADYKCIAYRAGGFCIQPEAPILAALKENNIIIDSSICKRLYANTSSHKYNFCNAPCDHDWRFNIASGILTYDCEGEFIEIPIGAEYKIPHKWVSVHTSPRLKRGELKGQTSQDTDQKVKKALKYYNKIKDFFYQGVMMSLDSSHYIALEKMIINYLGCHDCDRENHFITVIGHPKLFIDENYTNLISFIEIIQRKYSGRVSFCTVSEAFNFIEEKGDRL